MDPIEFCLQLAQMLQLRKCTFQKMARSRSINLESVIALQDSQPVTIGTERTRKDQANHQGGSRSYLQLILLTPLKVNSNMERSNSVAFLTGLLQNRLLKHLNPPDDTHWGSICHHPALCDLRARSFERRGWYNIVFKLNLNFESLYLTILCIIYALCIARV